MAKKIFDMGTSHNNMRDLYDILAGRIKNNHTISWIGYDLNTIQIDDSDWLSLYDIEIISHNLLITKNEFLELPTNLINFFMKSRINEAAIAGKRKELLEYYIEMFNEIPSGSHMVRAYTYMEQIFLDKYSKSEITIDEKAVARFDKLKALALNNANISERKLAFMRSIKQFCKIAVMEDLKIPEEE